MKKLLLFAVVISGLALTSCTKTRDCECETTVTGFPKTTAPAVEYKGKCEDLAKELEEASIVSSVSIECHEH